MSIHQGNISLSEIESYHRIFNPAFSLPHFTRIIAAADRAYLKTTAKDRKKEVKSSGLLISQK